MNFPVSWFNEDTNYFHSNILQLVLSNWQINIENAN